MSKTIRLFAVAGLVAAVVALAVTVETQTTSVAERGTRVDDSGYTQLAWGEMSAQRSGR
jgi:hypothetical protein